MENIEVPQPSEVHSKAVEAIRYIDKEFKQQQIPYFLIGAYARNAYMGVVPNKASDVDLLVTESSKKQQAEEILKTVRQNHPDVIIDTSLSELVCSDKGKYSLKYGPIEYSVDSNLMQERRVKFQGAEFSTLLPEVLLHTYSFVGGPFREKDWQNSLRFARYIKDQRKQREGDEYDHKLFEPFHQFSRDRWNKFPLRRLQYIWRKTFSALPPDIKQFLLNKVYPNEQIQGIRMRLNTLQSTLCAR